VGVKPKDPFQAFDENDDRPEVVALLDNLKKSLPALKKLLKTVSGHWSYEDGIYRFYHQSFKVFFLQETTLEIVEALKNLIPAPDPKRDRPRWYYYQKREKVSEPPLLHPWFMKIVSDGTGKTFDLKDNDRWLEATRPIVEAFTHAKFFLEMAVQYGMEFDKDERPPCMLPSGWAAFLYLYDLR
jgi:hypothetical protein